MERLSAEDRLMLRPDRLWPQDIGALALLDGSPLLDDDGRLPLGAVREAVAGRLHLVPRFRQLLFMPPRGLGRPLWVDDPAFDLAAHVRFAQVPEPGDEAALLRSVEAVRSRRLDMSRPLWEMWFLTGLAGRRVALFVRLHHVLADGIAGVATMSAFFDTAAESAERAPTAARTADPTAAPTAAPTVASVVAPGAAPAPAPPWQPAAAPTPRELLLDDLRDRGRRLRRGAAALAHPAGALRNARAAWSALHDLVAEDRAPVTSLDRIVGPGRRIALVRGRLDELLAVAHAHGGTVNDVLLAGVAGGLRALLRGRGEPDDVVLRVYVPVTLRAADQRSRARGNLIGQMAVPVPLGIADPGARLRAIAGETARRKARPHPSLGSLLSNPVVAALTLTLLRRNPVNVETADLPGPPVPLFFAGAPVLEVFPLLNLIGNVPLGIGGLSYAGQFGVMAVADRSAVPDLGVFAAGMAAEMRALSPAERSSAAASGATR